LPSIAREALERRKAIQEAERTAADKMWQGRDNLVFTDSIGDMSNPDPCPTASRTPAKLLDCRRPGSTTFATPRRH
jgi:hypothetical protein